MTVLTEFAPAKINLTLEVLGKRADGYHELQSLVAFADVGDVLTLDTLRPLGVTTSGPFGASIAGANLVETALRMVAGVDERLKLGAVLLEKNLPVAAGIGGGSADAAAVLRLVQRANPEFAPDVDWLGLARRLGADVPVCMESRLSWMTGLGERVEPIKLKPPFAMHAVIANPLISVPADKTAQVFRALRAPQLLEEKARVMPPKARSGTELFQIIASGHNGLERAAIEVVPVIADILRALRELPGARLARLSGGGPTCFAIFESADGVEKARAQLAAARPSWWVAKAKLG